MSDEIKQAVDATETETFVEVEPAVTPIPTTTAMPKPGRFDIQSMGQTALTNAGVMMMTSVAVAGMSKVLQAGATGLAKAGKFIGRKVSEVHASRKEQKAAKKAAKLEETAQEKPEEATPEEEKTE